MYRPRVKQHSWAFGLDGLNERFQPSLILIFFLTPPLYNNVYDDE